MKNYIGIDLGTTNSAICSYNGNQVRIWKSPSQNDVTPSAIYIDRRGNKHVGRGAYDQIPYSPGNTATLFKRHMGTSTPIRLTALDINKTPEECSAEILRTLFGYLTEEIRSDPDTATVITVPAAFNQMQKDATMQAAQMAGIGKVALMQEPVAAVMSVMKTNNTDGMFLIYDFGGGTLDIAIAQSISGTVSLLAHGGIQMCGGRDFDRILVDNVVKPWLLDNFDLPEDFHVNPQFKKLIPLATWATEKTKIELSSKNESVINLSEDQIRIQDTKGNDIYLDITVSRNDVDQLISSKIEDTIVAARETITKAGLSEHDLEKIVFIGGPTNYKPLRDKVSFELGIPGSTETNPMTAVAEGASIFAESIDWKAKDRSRKSSRGQIRPSAMEVSFNYISRTPDAKAKIVAQLTGNIPDGAEFQIDSIDTGWTSGKLQLNHGKSLDVILPKMGENLFKVFVFDPQLGPVKLDNDKIIITRTAATIDAIPASHSIFVEVLKNVGGITTSHYLIKSGEILPIKGKQNYKAAESINAGDANSINIKLWEGDIEDPITDNRYIGVLKISGTDFDNGIIPVGADIEFEYEILDSGNIMVKASVECIGWSSSNKNFYSSQEGHIDYSNAYAIVQEEGNKTLSRIEEISELVDDSKLDQIQNKLNSILSMNPNETDPEVILQAHEDIRSTRRTLAEIRKNNLKEIRQLDLEKDINFFDNFVKEHASSSDISTFDNLVKTAQKSINKPGKDFEHYHQEIKGKIFEILWKQDWFVIERFKHLLNSPHLFVDQNKFEQLSKAGSEAIRRDKIDELRGIIAHMYSISIGISAEDDFLENANIMRG